LRIAISESGTTILNSLSYAACQTLIISAWQIAAYSTTG
jgi:hypothetical protein